MQAEQRSVEVWKLRHLSAHRWVLSASFWSVPALSHCLPRHRKKRAISQDEHVAKRWRSPAKNKNPKACKTTARYSACDVGSQDTGASKSSLTHSFSDYTDMLTRLGQHEGKRIWLNLKATFVATESTAKMGSTFLDCLLVHRENEYYLSELWLHAT